MILQHHLVTLHFTKNKRLVVLAGETRSTIITNTPVSQGNADFPELILSSLRVLPVYVVRQMSIQNMVMMQVVVTNVTTHQL